MNPVDELRTAAATLRKLAAAIHAPDLDDQAWHTEECADDDQGNCPCIVAQGSYSWHDEPSKPLYYVADVETPELAAYIAAMGPDVGMLLADTFDAWARMGELDPDLLHRVGGPETLNIARQINTRSQP